MRNYKVHHNLVTNNFGEGISVRNGANLNSVDNNQISGHPVDLVIPLAGDLVELGAGPNNGYLGDCFTTTNIVPAPTPANKCPKKGVGV